MLSSLPVLLAAAGCSPDSAVTTPGPEDRDTGIPGGQFLVATGGPPAPPAPPAQVADETSWCWYLAFADAETTGLYVAGMDSGTTVEIARYPFSPVWSEGMTWTGDAFVAANGAHGFQELYLDGSSVSSDRYSRGGLAWLNGAGLAAGGGFLDRARVYATFDDLVADQPIGALPMMTDIESYDLEGDTLYGAWGAGDHLEEYDITTGDLTRTIPLEGFDSAMSSDSYAGGFLHVADDIGTEPQFLPRIVRFDLDGHAISEVNLPNPRAVASGLWCDAPR